METKQTSKCVSGREGRSSVCESTCEGECARNCEKPQKAGGRKRAREGARVKECKAREDQTGASQRAREQEKNQECVKDWRIKQETSAYSSVCMSLPLPLPLPVSALL
eukprot:1524588-Pleurochrysis_carterae.AAC.1